MLKIQKEFFQTTSLTYFLHTFTKSHPLRKSCLVSVRFKRISCIDIERSLQRGPRGLHRESWKMVEEFSAEREARTIASRYSIYRVFVRWDLVITWQNIFSFCRFLYNNVERYIGLFTRDVGSIYTNMSQLLKMEQDVQEKERMMIGLTGVLDKDILKRFVKQRFIRKLISKRFSFDYWRPFCYFVACRCPICRIRVRFMAPLECKFIGEYVSRRSVTKSLDCQSLLWFSLFFFYLKFSNRLISKLIFFLVSKETIKFFDFSLRF